MNCLIVDDDPLVCDLLQHFCSKVEAISSVTTTNDGFESVNLISQGSYDLILLDYDLPDITGKEILQVVPGSTAVIMITANKEFGSDSYNYIQVVDYLVKPVDFPRFVKAIAKVRERNSQPEQKNETLFIKDGNDLVKVDLKEVKYVKSAANYVEVIQQDKKIMSLMKMKDLEQSLPDYFQRVHRSYIVNVNHIDKISKGDVVIGDEEISISSTYEKDLLSKINFLK